jgi:hypothetical protein
MGFVKESIDRKAEGEVPKGNPKEKYVDQIKRNR